MGNGLPDCRTMPRLPLAQNHFALNYVNTLWTEARRQPWPHAVAIRSFAA